MTEKAALEKAGEYLLNTRQPGEALELLTNLENNSVSLVFSIRNMNLCGMFYALIILYIPKVIIRF